MIAEILTEAKRQLGGVSKITINRDLNKLKRAGFILRRGRSTATVYDISKHYNLIKPVDIAGYFKQETDKRSGMASFNFEIFSFLKNIFTGEEKKYLKELNSWCLANIKNIPGDAHKKEFERLMIELSWKSSQIEGNTYTLLETELLIKENKEAKGHKREEAMMILNHKRTLEYIRSNKSNFKKITVSKIEDVHSLLVKNLKVSKGLRKSVVGIVGTAYKPLDNIFQIKEALEKTCKLVNGESDPFAKAIILSIMIAYIQPFEDGNKRTSRMASNAILMAYNICPLSYRSVDEAEYKKAVILFYEQNNINYFKRLFVEQFEFAVKNYFQTFRK